MQLTFHAHQTLVQRFGQAQSIVRDCSSAVHWREQANNALIDRIAGYRLVKDPFGCAPARIYPYSNVTQLCRKPGGVFGNQEPTYLIVLGSHGRRGLYRSLMRSVSDAVVRHAHCCVELVRLRPEHQGPQARTSASCNLGESSATAVAAFTGGQTISLLSSFPIQRHFAVGPWHLGAM